MKYLAILRSGKESIHAWSDPEITHADMADVFVKVPIVSAGFIVWKSGELVCTGRSESLNKDSRPRDTALLRASINATTAVQGE